MQVIHFQFKDFDLTFMTLLNIGFNFFAKLRRGSFLTPTSAYRNVSKENIYKSSI